MVKGISVLVLLAALQLVAGQARHSPQSPWPLQDDDEDLLPERPEQPEFQPPVDDEPLSQPPRDNVRSQVSPDSDARRRRPSSRQLQRTESVAPADVPRQTRQRRPQEDSVNSSGQRRQTSRRGSRRTEEPPPLASSNEPRRSSRRQRLPEHSYIASDTQRRTTTRRTSQDLQNDRTLTAQTSDRSTFHTSLDDAEQEPLIGPSHGGASEDPYLSTPDESEQERVQQLPPQSILTEDIPSVHSSDDGQITDYQQPSEEDLPEDLSYPTSFEDSQQSKPKKSPQSFLTDYSLPSRNSGLPPPVSSLDDSERKSELVQGGVLEDPPYVSEGPGPLRYQQPAREAQKVNPPPLPSPDDVLRNIRRGPPQVQVERPTLPPPPPPPPPPPSSTLDESTQGALSKEALLDGEVDLTSPEDPQHAQLQDTTVSSEKPSSVASVEEPSPPPHSVLPDDSSTHAIDQGRQTPRRGSSRTDSQSSDRRRPSSRRGSSRTVVSDDVSSRTPYDQRRQTIRRGSTRTVHPSETPSVSSYDERRQSTRRGSSREGSSYRQSSDQRRQSPRRGSSRTTEPDESALYNPPDQRRLSSRRGSSSTHDSRTLSDQRRQSTRRGSSRTGYPDDSASLTSSDIRRQSTRRGPSRTIVPPESPSQVQEHSRTVSTEDPVSLIPPNPSQQTLVPEDALSSSLLDEPEQSGHKQSQQVALQEDSSSLTSSEDSQQAIPREPPRTVSNDDYSPHFLSDEQQQAPPSRPSEEDGSLSAHSPLPPPPPRVPVSEAHQSRFNQFPQDRSQQSSSLDQSRQVRLRQPPRVDIPEDTLPLSSFDDSPQRNFRPPPPAIPPYSPSLDKPQQTRARQFSQENLPEILPSQPSVGDTRQTRGRRPTQVDDSIDESQQANFRRPKQESSTRTSLDEQRRFRQPPQVDLSEDTFPLSPREESPQSNYRQLPQEILPKNSPPSFSSIDDPEKTEFRRPPPAVVSEESLPLSTSDGSRQSIPRGTSRASSVDYDSPSIYTPDDGQQTSLRRPPPAVVSEESLPLSTPDGPRQSIPRGPPPASSVDYDSPSLYTPDDRQQTSFRRPPPEAVSEEAPSVRPLDDLPPASHLGPTQVVTPENSPPPPPPPPPPQPVSDVVETTSQVPARTVRPPSEQSNIRSTPRRGSSRAQTSRTHDSTRQSTRRGSSRVTSQQESVPRFDNRRQSSRRGSSRTSVPEDTQRHQYNRRQPTRRGSSRNSLPESRTPSYNTVRQTTRRGSSRSARPEETFHQTDNVRDAPRRTPARTTALPEGVATLTNNVRQTERRGSSRVVVPETDRDIVENVPETPLQGSPQVPVGSGPHLSSVDELQQSRPRPPSQETFSDDPSLALLDESYQTAPRRPSQSDSLEDIPSASLADDRRQSVRRDPPQVSLPTSVADHRPPLLTPVDEPKQTRHQQHSVEDLSDDFLSPPRSQNDFQGAQRREPQEAIVDENPQVDHTLRDENGFSRQVEPQTDLAEDHLPPRIPEPPTSRAPVRQRPSPDRGLPQQEDIALPRPIAEPSELPPVDPSTPVDKLLEDSTPDLPYQDDLEIRRPPQQPPQTENVNSRRTQQQRVTNSDRGRQRQQVPVDNSNRSRSRQRQRADVSSTNSRSYQRHSVSENVIPVRRQPQGRGSRDQTPSKRPSVQERKVTFNCPEPYGYFADKQQCDRYFECRNGTVTEGLCPDGLVFNTASTPQNLRCDAIRDIDCSSRPELQPARSTANCPRRFGMYPHKTDCTRFWNCVDGQSTEITCPSGLAYNDERGTCDWADLVHRCDTEELVGFTCPENDGEPLREGAYLRYPHPTDCRLHYVCLKGKGGESRPRLLSCTDGLVFDSETSKCEKPSLVEGCEDYYGEEEIRAPSRSQTTRRRTSQRRQDSDS